MHSNRQNSWVTRLFMLTLLAACALVYRAESQLLNGMVLVDGQVVRITRAELDDRSWRASGVDVRASVRYSYQGREHIVRSRFFGIPRWQLDEPARVYVAPDAPDRARLARWDDAYLLTLTSFAWFLLCALALLLRFLFRSTAKRR